METTVTATFEVKGWDESPVDEGEGLGKITRASVKKEFSGDIDGTGTLEYLMAYADDGSATFVGLERVRGSLAGRSGTFVLEHRGRFEEGAAKGPIVIAPGSGTDELSGLAGSGELVADPQGSLTLSVTFG